MFDSICTLPLTADIFGQSLHPTEPLLAVGLSSGHVQVFRLPAAGDDGEARKSNGGFGKIITQWRTRRHKGSCRSLQFSLDGDAVQVEAYSGECHDIVLYSAGTDGIVKAASSSTGQVTAKIAIPANLKQSISDTPSLVHPLSPQSLLVASDSSALHVYDLRAGSAPFSSNQRPQQTYHPNDDYVSSISSLRPTESSSSGTSKQWITTGATTLALTDLRRGVVARSEDQEEELLSSLVVSGIPAKFSRGAGEKVIVGGAGGVLTLWNRGFWQDQDDRIVVDKAIGGGESLDAVTMLPDDIDQLPDRSLAVGMGNGLVRIVGLYPNKVLDELLHDDVEGVVALGVDPGGRLISAGGQTVKIWTPREVDPEEERVKNGIGGRKRVGEGEDADSDSEDDDEDDSEDEPAKAKRRKRRRKGKGGRANGTGNVLGFTGLD